jgi:hypothetical protein
VLPEEKDAADLLRRMQTVATQSNLDQELRRRRQSPSSCTPVAIELQLEGNATTCDLLRPSASSRAS